MDLFQVLVLIRAAWWFGTMEFYDFPFSWECQVIPTDFRIFFRGVGQPPTSSFEIPMLIPIKQLIIQVMQPFWYHLMYLMVAITISYHIPGKYDNPRTRTTRIMNHLR